MKPVKPKKCKNKDCGKMFTPSYSTTQPVCSPGCALKLSKEKAAIAEKRKRNAETKEMKQAIMTKGNWMEILQATFNTFIRLRDKDQPCISCGVMVSNKWDAGHFYPTTYSYLRLHEDNVHKQCSKNCNMEKHGNMAEYRPRLISRIGLQRVLHLDNSRHLKLELSIPEIKELIVVYKEKIKQLKAA